VGSLGPLGLLAYFFTTAEERDRNYEVGVVFFSALFIIGLGMFFSLRSGKKEYEKLKRKRENQGHS
jgi:fructose-specific phosphotransferase system IIC component